MEAQTTPKLKKPPTPSKPITELWWFFAAAACVKLLLIPACKSTDVEVHRHWLAITHSLPLSQWYVDETCPWTLDYPPFFGYFERFLSIFANLIDAQIVHLQKGLNYSSNVVLYFQRISVIFSDLCLLYEVYILTRKLDSTRQKMIWVLVVWSPMLVIVDHLHFQYNGFFLWDFVDFTFLFGGREGLDGWTSFCCVVVLQAFVCCGGYHEPWAQINRIS